MKCQALQKYPLMHAHTRESIREDAQAVIDRWTRLTVHLSVMQMHLCVHLQWLLQINNFMRIAT